MASLPSSSGLMRSTLRDTVKRLKKIREKAGKNDDAEKQAQSTGDPFRDKCNLFITTLKKSKELISERNTGMKKNGRDRTAIEQTVNIKKEFKVMVVLLQEIGVMVDEADRMLAKENKKKKPKANKVQLLERQWKERQKQHKDCTDMLEAVKTLESKGADEPKSGKAGVAAGDQLEFGKKAKLREQLNLGTLSTRAKKNAEKAAAAASGEGGTEMSAVSAEEEAEVKKHQKDLADQEALINRGLDRLRGNVSNLRDIAMEIGSQLDMQNAMLENTENTIDKQTKQLKGINRRLNKIFKTQSPMQTCMTVSCIFLLLALVGFFLMQFGIV